MKVYIAGPYRSNGTTDVVANVRAAILVFGELVKLGYTPLVPHLNLLIDFIVPQTEEFWLAYDLVFLRDCDALFRLPGDSRGADAEVAKAEEWGIPVVYTAGELVQRCPLDH